MSHRSRARGLIGSRHGRPIAELLARVARKYLSAYDNLSNWEMKHNGELRAFRRIADRIDGDVLDVGANAGQWAASILPYLGGKPLHCFEPVPATFEKLKATLPASAQIHLNPFGLGSRDGTLCLNYAPGCDTISSRYPLVFDSVDQQAVECRIRLGDDYLREQGITAISFLKIDVEGMEMETLKGLKGALQRGTVAAIQFEHGPAHVHSRHFLHDFLDFLRPYGFHFYVIRPNKLDPLDYLLDDESFAGRNLLALHERHRDVALQVRR